MIFLRRLVSFLMVLSVTLYIGYFSYVNTKPIHFYSVPGLGELRMPAAIGFLGSFARRCSIYLSLFGYTSFKKVVELPLSKKRAQA